MNEGGRKEERKGRDGEKEKEIIRKRRKEGVRERGMESK